MPMNDIVPKFLMSILIFSSTCILAWTLILLAQEFLKEYEKQYVSETAKSLSEMFIFQDPKKVFLFNIIITVVFLLIGFACTDSIISIGCFGAFGFFLPRIFIWQAKKARFEKFAGQMVDGLLVLSNAMKSGMTLVQAMEILEAEQPAPISQEFGLVLREYKLGVPLETALENITKRMPNDDLKLMVSATNIVLGMGGNLMRIFDSLANVIRERSKLEGKTKALTSQGKLQGLVVGLLPTALGVMMYLLDPPMITRMLKTLSGNLALGLMVFLQVLGYFMIRKITSIEI
jgi:tight adherence protein B